MLWETLWLATGGIGFAHSWEMVGFVLNRLTTGSFWVSFLTTVGFTLAGLTGGVLVALVVGVPLGSSEFLERSSRGLLFFGRSLPSVALIPLLLASLGSRSVLVVILVTWLVAIKMVFFVLRGVRDIRRGHDEQARALRLTAPVRTLFVRLPAASAIVATGVRLTVNRAYGAVILGGLIAGTGGIGRDIQLARINGDSDAVLGFAVLAGLIGVLFFWAFRLLEARVVHWRPVS